MVGRSRADDFIPGVLGVGAGGGRPGYRQYSIYDIDGIEALPVRDEEIVVTAKGLPGWAVRLNRLGHIGMNALRWAEGAGREGAFQADTAVRGAANELTLDMADNGQAALEASLGLWPQSTWRGRYEAAMQAQERRNAYDREHRRAAMEAGDALGLGLGLALAYRTGVNPVGGRVVQVVNGLSTNGKRYVGEGMSVLKTLGRGDIPISFQKPLRVAGGKSITDHQTLRGYTVEAKYRASGKRGSLTRRQKEAKQMLGDKYMEEWWGPEDVRRFSGKTATGGLAAGQAVDRRNEH